VERRGCRSVSSSAGTGIGSVGYSVAANASTTVRTGALTIAGTAVTMTQAGVPCSYKLSGTSQTFNKDGGNGSMAVTTTSACTWLAASTAGWITVTPPIGTTGDGKIGYKVAKNGTHLDRTGTLTIAGKSVTILQKR